MKSVLVITPTTGSLDVIDAIKSVTNQTYENVEHLLVVDGSKFSSDADRTLNDAGIFTCGKIRRADIPYNTGGKGYYGHRVMAAFSHLADHDYIMFLDQDNWYEPDHVQSLVEECERHNYEWTYSLRNIFNKNKEFICQDNCESLGRYPAYINEQAFLIDSSSYCFTNNFIRMTGHLWDFGWGADRRFYSIVKDQMQHKNYGSNNKHTLNYRLGGNEGSVTDGFFFEGNRQMNQRYNGVYPWTKQYK